MAPYLEKARVGPAAVSPFRIHPIDIAANTALLADLAPGGVYIGLARGAWLAENGISEPEKPITGIRESVMVLRKLLSGATVDFIGDVFSLRNIKAPYPVPAENIPLMIGTWGRKLAQLAGELADEVKIGGSANPAMVSLIRKEITVGTNRAGRSASDVGVVVGAVTVVDEDRNFARALARRNVAMYLPVVLSLDPTTQLEPELNHRIREAVELGDLASAVELISDDILDLFAFSGTPTDIAQQANMLLEAGAARVEFGTPHGSDSSQGIRLIGTKVLPAIVSC
jgi:5,10-methylenetetrahydromethanopterin reductase